MKHLQLTPYWTAVMLVASLAACTSLNLGGSGGGSGPIPTPTSSATTSPAPGACGTANPDPNVVVVAMGNNVGPTTAPTYGIINGYAVVQNGEFPDQATLINQWVNQSGNLASITANNVLQFTNVDTAAVAHSAVGFKGDSFPAVPYTFPTAAASPVASAVSDKTLWSTGRINPSVSQQCYSQTFTLSGGVYYFGDLDYYNLSNVRDVLIVATAGPASANKPHFAAVAPVRHRQRVSSIRK